MTIRNSCFLFFFSLLLMQGCTAQSRLEPKQARVLTAETFNYYLYYPPGYRDGGESEYPLLLFLHGGGDAGGTLEMLRESGPPRLLAEGNDFPFLILAPQNPYKKQWWNTRAVMELLEQVIAENRVDRNRLYLTGLSRGGSACWELATQYPGTFAAMAVVCGMAPAPYAHWIDREMGIRVFHGTEDEVIPFSESEEMVARLRSLGYEVTFTAYEGVGHNAWERAYLEEGLYDWFLQFSR
ncbi:prolyl oligopeptidase family serine peptidase [Robiginitalea marina]|uniref:Prolyl oligopeptidase family serine peptidase n=1 Tax=Robiginitalea marina TaxID=2954105 RepID=A0ABT1AUI5_9FLAO|nr:prolyl oligopeptidase family serine peptidase [Robiginitalea marina]MCO5723285.1 prolyl oligopeptidase family serine peptidase [Robiginitalea marina]